MSNISLNYQPIPSHSCRVMNTPAIEKTGPGSAMRGSQIYTNPSGFTTFNYGETLENFAGNLTEAQQRSFLFPSVWYEGCVIRNCISGAQCPQSVKATISPETKAMFDQNFAPEAEFVGNSAPRSIFQPSKCMTYSSTNGWETSKQDSTKLNWQVNEMSETMGCGN